MPAVPGKPRVKREHWSDGDLVHVAHHKPMLWLGFCSAMPAVVDGRRSTETVEGPATCIECVANEGKDACKL